jgi:flavin-binding protein dodecin
MLKQILKKIKIIGSAITRGHIVNDAAGDYQVTLIIAFKIESSWFVSLK